MIDGYGCAVNPIGSDYQSWHVDYATDRVGGSPGLAGKELRRRPSVIIESSSSAGFLPPRRLVIARRDSSLKSYVQDLIALAAAWRIHLHGIAGFLANQGARRR